MRWSSRSGAAQAMDAVPGLAEHGVNVWSREGLEHAHQRGRRIPRRAGRGRHLRDAAQLSAGSLRAGPPACRSPRGAGDRGRGDRLHAGADQPAHRRRGWLRDARRTAAGARHRLPAGPRRDGGQRWNGRRSPTESRSPSTCCWRCRRIGLPPVLIDAGLADAGGWVKVDRCHPGDRPAGGVGHRRLHRHRRCQWHGPAEGGPLRRSGRARRSPRASRRTCAASPPPRPSTEPAPASWRWEAMRRA